MPIRWIESPDHIQNVTVNPPGEDRKYKLYGTISRTSAISYATGASPAILLTGSGTLYRQDIKAAQFAFDSWDITVPYASKKREVGEFTWDFDTTGGTVHITNSKETIRKFKRSDISGNIPDTSGAIDIQPDEVKGVDVVIPTMKFNVSFKHPAFVVTTAYARFLQSITGMVNSTPFFSWAAGEVLFLGASGSDGTETEASVQYQFAMSTGTTNLSIGGLTWKDEAGNVANIEKEGWNTLWLRYEEGVDEGEPIRKPAYVYIERVYETVDLAQALGFGTPGTV